MKPLCVFSQYDFRVTYTPRLTRGWWRRVLDWIQGT